MPADAVRAQMVEAVRTVVAEAVADALPKNVLTEEERQWVRLAIQREAQSIKLRQAVIEKTLTGLIWAALAGAGVMFADWVRMHGWKP